MNLYRMNPDGSGLELLYGPEPRHRHAMAKRSSSASRAKLEDGRIISLIRPFTDTEGGGELVAIDTPQYVENTQPTAPNIGILNGPAQEDATVQVVSTEPGRTVHRRPIRIGLPDSRRQRPSAR